MLLGTIQIASEDLPEGDVKDICDSLRDNSIRFLSLRGCRCEDGDFKKLTESLKENESLIQLNLNLGVCNGKHRIKWLAEALLANKTLSALFLHGTKLGDEGLEMLMPALHTHPKLQSLDLGDCRLGDDGVRQLCTLLPPSENKADLTELTLSANQKVTPHGWAHLAIAMAASSHLRCLYLDYNSVGDFGAGAFAVALASSSSLERIDFEGSGITEYGAALFFDVVANYPMKLQELVLSENDVSVDLLGQINDCLVKPGPENGEQEESGQTISDESHGEKVALDASP